MDMRLEESSGAKTIAEGKAEESQEGGSGKPIRTPGGGRGDVEFSPRLGTERPGFSSLVRWGGGGSRAGGVAVELSSPQLHPNSLLVCPPILICALPAAACIGTPVFQLSEHLLPCCRAVNGEGSRDCPSGEQGPGWS